MRIILIRHGEPNYEKDCLTELGHRQAEAAAQRLLEEGIEEIYSSPHGRALQTAEAFSKASGIEKIHVVEFIREIRYGREGELYDKKWNPWSGADELVASGKSIQTDRWREYPVYADNYATVDADKIKKETDQWLSTLGYEREGLYYRCKRQTDEQKTIALFNHGGASAAFLSQIFNQPFPFMCSLNHFGFTAISILRFDKTPGKLSLPTIELLNDSRHTRNIK